MAERTIVELSPKTILHTVLIVGGFVLLTWCVWFFKDLLFSLFLGFVIMSGLRPMVDRFERWKIPRFLAATIVFISTIFFIIFLAAFILPPVLVESMSFVKNVPILLLDVFPFLGYYIKNGSLSDFIPQLTPSIPQITQHFFALAGGVFSNILAIVSVLFLTFYFLLEKNFAVPIIEYVFSKRQSVQLKGILFAIERKMGAWMWGQLLLMIIVGVFTYIGLVLFQVPYALPLAFFAGLLEVIPILGPIVAAIPAFLVVASTSLVSGIMVLILYVVIQQVENHIFVPLIMRKTVGLHPVITLIAISIGGKLAGPGGMLLSVPVALFVQTVASEVMKLRKQK